ncbi:MAG TPA: phosphopantetheine-binding protein [Kofleriaceae bacterium]|nr:phosphopantetheine-binding protein [Kofleriaceae bacterium]
MTVQQTIASLWQEQLGVPDVQPSDDFISLGGNSIAATLVANRIEEQLRVRPEVAEIFSTLESLTSHCEDLIRERDQGASA